MILADRTIEYERGQKIYFGFLGDVHYEVLNCDVAHLEKDTNYLGKNGYYVVGMGDYHDAILPDDKRYEHQIIREDFRVLSPSTMLTRTTTELASFFRPFYKSGKLLGILHGNHELTLEKRHSRNLIYELCNEIAPISIQQFIEEKRHPLDIGYRCGMRLRFVRRDKDGNRNHSSVFTFCLWHGWGYAITREGRLRILRRKSDEFLTDLTVVGHWHDLCFEQDVTRSSIQKTGVLKLQTTKRWLGMSGTYYKSLKEGVDGFTDRKAFPAAEIGCLKVEIDPENRIIKRVDERY